jgi:hypothetical protein
MRFYLGTHEPSWLRRTDVPLFLSAVRLRRYRTFPAARGRWALDSGGFSELQAHGTWTVGARQYASEVVRWVEEVGMPDFVAIQDWMCEPFMLAKTGRTIAEHQRLTIESYATLRQLAPEVPWMPVLQGWRADDYESHVEQYRAAGFELCGAPVVGVGSVCRRQGTHDGAGIMARAAGLGLRVHAFGVKVTGLALFGDRIASADSMTWSFVARRRRVRLPECSHVACSNCFRWAHEWYRTRIRDRVSIDDAPSRAQLPLPGVLS